MKKHYIKRLFATVAVLLCYITANAHDFEVDGIYYKILSASDLTAQVTYKGNSYDEFTDEYSGEVIIPSTVSYKSKTLTVASIGKSTFQKCSGLTSITIPNSVTSIENNAFNGCTSLKELHIEDGTETLSLGYNYYASSDIYGGDGLCNDCPLENLYLGRNLSYYDDDRYGDSPFKYKRTLTSITIGNSVTSIGRKLFYGCESLTSVTIPNSVTSIKYQAFLGCSNLTSITIPNGVTSIGNSAFRECLVLTSVTIGNNVTSIGAWTFRGCSALTSVVIGNSVTSIGEEAFDGCTGLTNIQLLSKTPPTVESGNFAESQYTDITLYVPVGSLETYQAADTWKNFWDIQEFDVTAIENIEEVTPAFEITSNGIQFTAADSKTVAIYTVAGALIEKVNSYASETITLDKGVYIIHIGEETTKVKL